MGFLDYLTSGWLNKTYAYLKETGGPTYPPSKSLGPLKPTTKFTEDELAAVEIGSYSVLPNEPVIFSVPQAIKIPFNAGNTGIVPYQANKADMAAEIAHETSIPKVLSNSFGKLYGNMMNACVADQTHRHNNPCAGDACREFAETGDSSRMMLTVQQKEALGISSVVKPDNVQAAENKSDETFTEKISQGVRGMNTWASNLTSAMAPPKGGGVLTDADTGFPEGVNFSSIKKGIAGIFPSTPKIDGTTTLLLIGGGVLILILLIRR